MSISDFLLFPKNGFVVGVRSLKVTARHLNNAGCCYEYTIVSVPRIARRYTIQCSLPNTNTVHIELWTAAGRQAGREAEKERGRVEDGRKGAREQGESGNKVTRGREGGREGRKGGSDDDRQGESVSGGREGRGREGC